MKEKTQKNGKHRPAGGAGGTRVPARPNSGRLTSQSANGTEYLNSQWAVGAIGPSDRSKKNYRRWGTGGRTWKTPGLLSLSLSLWRGNNEDTQQQKSNKIQNERKGWTWDIRSAPPWPAAICSSGKRNPIAMSLDTGRGPVNPSRTIAARDWLRRNPQPIGGPRCDIIAAPDSTNQRQFAGQPRSFT